MLRHDAAKSIYNKSGGGGGGERESFKNGRTGQTCESPAQSTKQAGGGKVPNESASILFYSEPFRLDLVLKRGSNFCDTFQNVF